MTEFIQGIAILALYRIITIACSLALIFWGYLLLRKGAAADAGGLRPGSKRSQTTTGAMLALLGAVMFVVSILRGIDVEGIRTGMSRNAISANHIGSPATTAATPESRDPTADREQYDLPEEIKRLLNKAAAGQVLSGPDRKVLNDWIKKNQSSNGRIGQPRSEGQKRETKRAPVPAPGEV